MIFTIISHWLMVILLAPFFIGVIAVVKAGIAGKRGPHVLQPYFDLIKLAHKQSIYSRTTTWVFRLTPVVVLSAVLAASLMVPFGIFKAPVQFSGDFLLFVYILALARFFMISAAFDTGFSMDSMGASREAFFACFSEVALFMNFITLALLAHSVSLSNMVGAYDQVSWSAMGPVLLLLSASLFILLLAENCRIPVDDPDTHLELTMIHEVMILDHSGIDLAYLLYAAAIKMFIFSGILVSILLPVSSHDPVLDILLFLGCMMALAVLVGVVESAMARIRLNRVKNFLLIAFSLAFFGLIVTLWRR